jgi:protein-S-isoprenylcysteine O-methyltransferase Ste14
MLNWINLIVSLAAYTSFSWAAFFFFKTQTDHGKAGKKLIFISGSLSIFASLFLTWYLPQPDPRLAITSVVLFVFANVLFWWAYAIVRATPLDFAFSKSNPNFLVKTGPYRWVRHPFYVSYTCAWIAACFATQSPVFVVVPVFMFALYLKAARAEERIFLQSALASEYAQYQWQTPMFFPIFFFGLKSRKSDGQI